MTTTTSRFNAVNARIGELEAAFLKIGPRLTELESQVFHLKETLEYRDKLISELLIAEEIE